MLQQVENYSLIPINHSHSWSP